MPDSQKDPMDALLDRALKLTKDLKQSRVMPFHLLTVMVDTPEISDYLTENGYPVDDLRKGIDALFPDFKKADIADVLSAFARNASNISYDSRTIACWNGARSHAKGSTPGYLETLYFVARLGDSHSQIALQDYTDLDNDNILDLVVRQKSQSEQALKFPDKDQLKQEPLTIAPAALPIISIDKEFQKHLAARHAIIGLDKTMKEKIIGQDNAISVFHKALKRSMAGLKDPDKPLGSFLFPGPAVVGKTEVCKQLAKTLGVELIRLDMSEYMEKHSISRLIGAPPGYVGYSNGGLLSGPVEEHKNCILLLDEIEKAHPDVYNILLQVMDHGTLTDTQGNEIDFRNVILVMTSNAGSVTAQEPKRKFGFGNSEPEEENNSYDEAINALFKPEFRNRLDEIVPFDVLSKENMVKVTNILFNRLNTLEAASRYDLKFEATEAALQGIVDIGYDPKMGARPIERVINKRIKDVLADYILEDDLSEATIVVDHDGKDFTFKQIPHDHARPQAKAGNDNQTMKHQNPRYPIAEPTAP